MPMIEGVAEWEKHVASQGLEPGTSHFQGEYSTDWTTRAAYMHYPIVYRFDWDKW